MKELVSVIVPVYKAAAYIEDTIAMVERQTWKQQRIDKQFPEGPFGLTFLTLYILVFQPLRLVTHPAEDPFGKPVVGTGRWRRSGNCTKKMKECICCLSRGTLAKRRPSMRDCRKNILAKKDRTGGSPFLVTRRVATES